MQNEDLLRRVVDRYETAARARMPWEEKWKRFYRLYRSQAPPKNDETRANIFIPEVFTTVETIMPRLVAGYLATSKPPVDIVGREEQDQENAEAIKALLTYQFEQAEFPLFFNNYVKPALIFGTSIAKVYWNQTGSASAGPVMEALDLFDFFIDPEASSIADARYVIHRKLLSAEELRDRQNRGIYRKSDRIKGSGTDNNRNPALPAAEGDMEQDRREIEILEYWENNRVVTVADRSCILRDVPNPFLHGRKPFVDIVFIPVPHEFYGIGVIEPLEGLQNELNTKRNQRLDNVNLIINRMWIMQSGAVDDLRQLRSRPGGVIVANDINGLRPLPFNDVTRSAYQEEELILRDIQNTSGINEFVRGSLVDSNKVTATEIRVKAEQATTRLDYNLKLMAEKGIRQITRLIIHLNQQFMGAAQLIRIIGTDGVSFRRISPREITGNFDVKVSPDPAGLGEQERLQNTQAALSLVGLVPGSDPVPLVKEVLEKLGINERVISQVFAPLENQKTQESSTNLQPVPAGQDNGAAAADQVNGKGDGIDG